jgi:hypothetical protein
MSKSLISLCLSSCVLACGVDLGPCDSASVRTVVYDNSTGLPAYAGQAVLQTSCGNGAFCHSSAARDADRFGAPAGMNFDLQVVDSCSLDSDECRAADQTARLQAGLFETFDRRIDVWGTIDGETMPPGEIGKSLVEGAATFSYDSGTALPSILTKEGKSLVRNWLACSPPLEIVERTFEHPDEPDYQAIGAVVPPRAVDPPDATWSSIYEKAFAQRCATAQCHDAASHVADLDMSSAELAYADLVGQPAAQGEGGVCGSSGLERVAANDPDNSLLVQKLEQTQTCGSPMPIGTAFLSEPFIDPIREWITQGALDN